MNIQEDYVSFETAKLLKEKGFEGCSIITIYDEDAANAYIKELEEKHLPYSSDDPKLKEFYYTQPTLQMAMKWLREIYMLEVRSTYDYDKDSWWGNINPMFEETDENSDIYQKALSFDYQGKSYEQACEEAIKYCIKHLI